jgi:exopolysaccharide biosynthesis polyprenyl glycosylphosphotransferase
LAPSRRIARLFDRDHVASKLTADVIGIAGGVVLGVIAASAVATPVTRAILPRLAQAAVYGALLLAVLAVYGAYRRGAQRVARTSFDDLKEVIRAWPAGAFVALLTGLTVAGALGIRPFPAPVLAVAVAPVIVTVPLARWLMGRLSARVTAAGRRVLVVGGGDTGQRLAKFLSAQPGVSVVGLVDDDPMSGTEVAGRVADIPVLSERLAVSHVVVAFPRADPHTTLRALRPLHGRVPISIVPELFDLLSWRCEVDDLYGVPVIDVAAPQLGLGARAAKRAFDIVGSAALLVLCSPVMLLVAAVVKFTSPGPVLFRQMRTGRHGRPFEILKYRTMRNGAEAERGQLTARNEVKGPLFKLRHDPRVTQVGSFLRRTSLDELPQLINVLLGGMSLVGPRPFVVQESAELDDQLDGWAARRYEVRPGVTGLWQTSGRNDLSGDELCRLDYLYVASWSFSWDLRILWHTPSRVFRSTGVL